jgi:hypothetical protein
MFMIDESGPRPIQLPDRKEITLCEAVSAVCFGDAFSAPGPLLSIFNPPTCHLPNRPARKTNRPARKPVTVYRWFRPLDGEEQIEALRSKEEQLIERLQSAAYDGHIGFRALKNGEHAADGYREIDPLYFSEGRGFRWNWDQIWSRRPLSSDDRSYFPQSPAFTEDWHDVHLDRQQFEVLLQEMGVSVQRKTLTTGMPGRRTSKHLVLDLAQRRLNAGDYPPTLTDFSKQLAKELSRKEPLAAPATPKTVANLIRDLFREHKKLRKTEDPA